MNFESFYFYTRTQFSYVCVTVAKMPVEVSKNEANVFFSVSNADEDVKHKQNWMNVFSAFSNSPSPHA